jgi:hypothetical protein
MTLFEVEELTRYWAVNPPPHLLLGNLIGARRARSTSPPDTTARVVGGVAADLLGKLGPGLTSGDVHAGLPAATLDFAELRQRAKPSA